VGRGWGGGIGRGRGGGNTRGWKEVGKGEAGKERGGVRSCLLALGGEVWGGVG